MTNAEMEGNSMMNLEGFTRCDNKILDALCQVELSGRQYRMLLAITHISLQAGHTESFIPMERLQILTKYEGGAGHISADVRVLEKRRLIIRNGKLMRVNDDTSQWVLHKCQAEGNPK